MKHASVRGFPAIGIERGEHAAKPLAMPWVFPFVVEQRAFEDAEARDDTSGGAQL